MHAFCKKNNPPSVILLAEKERSTILTNKIEIAFTTECVCKEPDHLVQCNATIDNDRRPRHRRHAEVHLLVHQPECQRFVADERLVVTLTVCDAPFTMTTIRQSMHNVLDIPLIVRLVLQDLKQQNVSNIMQHY